MDAHTERQLIRRREAAALAGWSIPTLGRRERSDPNIPARIATGPEGGAPFAYRLAEWRAYLDGLPRSPAAPATPGASAKAAELARKGAAKRAATGTAPGTAEGKGAKPRGVNEAQSADAPSRCPPNTPRRA